VKGALKRPHSDGCNFRQIFPKHNVDLRRILLEIGEYFDFFARIDRKAEGATDSSEKLFFVFHRNSFGIKMKFPEHVMIRGSLS
jgi:hypothetical protein